MTTDLFIHRTGSSPARGHRWRRLRWLARRPGPAPRPAEVVLIDRVNHHLFQPLLYQVGAAVLLPPGDIAPSLRQVLADQPNTRVVLGEVSLRSRADRR